MQTILQTFYPRLLYLLYYNFPYKTRENYPLSVRLKYLPGGKIYAILLLQHLLA